MKNIFLILCSLFLFINCSDDDSSSENNGSNPNKITFNGINTSLNQVEYYDVPDDALYLYVYDGSAFYNGFHLIFPKTVFQNLNGTYTFNSERYSETYNPNSNFWRGIIENPETGLDGENVTGGEIIVAVNGNTITLNFELQTEVGTAFGSYTGSYKERE